jgi:ribosomal-protein-alanine N-acetyltransferase
LKKESVFKDLPQLETERLVLRKIKKQDVNDFFEYASDPEVSRFVTWDYHKTIKDSKRFINFSLRKYREHSAAPWGIVMKGNGKLIGTAGFAYWLPEHNRAEIGYSIGRNYWNKGLMTEAVREIIRFGFERMELNRLEARCSTDNAASEKVMLKCGMKFEGVLRQQEFIKGEYRSYKMYSILRGEWKQIAK